MVPPVNRFLKWPLNDRHFLALGYGGLSFGLPFLDLGAMKHG